MAVPLVITAGGIQKGGSGKASYIFISALIVAVIAFVIVVLLYTL